MPPAALGIDLGAKTVHVAVLGGDRARPTVVAAHTVDATDLVGVVAVARGVDEIAVDAPAALSEAVHRDDLDISRKFRVARCGEIGLGQQARIWVPWVTPSDPDAVAPWMLVGFDVWSALRAVGHTPIEVYPAGVFRVLAGRVPPRKTTRDGLRARIDLLDRYVELPPGIERWSHDGIDALAAALTAHQKATGAARAMCHSAPGCDGSAIWLPAIPSPA